MKKHIDHFLGSRVDGSGVSFRVWAPFAKAVSVLVGAEFTWDETALVNEGNGYWSGHVDGAQAGQAYKYQVTTPMGTTVERNDPRARQLTVSDNGASVIIDPEYDWENTVQPVIPKQKQIIYELHIGTFHRPDAATPGTFYTAIEKLDYLVELGITTIELMPVTSMATSNGWGYAPNYIYSVENSYGGRRGLLDFVKACHARGLIVVLDVVYNHFFPDTDLWQFDGWSENDRGGIYFYNDEKGDTPWGGRPDYGRPEVRQFIVDNVAMWLNDYRISGLRIDSTIYMRNTKGPDGDEATEIPEAWEVMRQINDIAHKISPDVLMIAEDSSAAASLTQPALDGGAGFDAQWALSFPHALRSTLSVDPNGSTNDLPFELTRLYNDDVYQKVIFSDSHDTAANGSVRLNEAATPGRATSVDARRIGLLANGITLTAAGIPMLLQGSEFMQEGAFNDWQMLDWDKTSQFKGIVLAHQHLMQLRRNIHGNTAGLNGDSNAVIHSDDNDKVYGFHRWQNGGPRDDVVVIANCNATTHHDYEIAMPRHGEWKVRFNSSWQGYSPDFHGPAIDSVITNDNKVITITLPAYALLVFSQE